MRWLPAWQGQSLNYMDMGDTFRMCRGVLNDRIQFWDGLYVKYLNRSLLP